MIRDRWKEPEARRLDGLDLLVYGSRLLGAEEDLVLHGGGNTSLKWIETDHAGRRVRVMRVKGSGGDLASIGAAPMVIVPISAIHRGVRTDRNDQAANGISPSS